MRTEVRFAYMKGNKGQMPQGTHLENRTQKNYDIGTEKLAREE